MLNTQISDSGWQPIIFHSAQGHSEIGWYPDISAGHLSAGISKTFCVRVIWYVNIIPFFTVQNIWVAYVYVRKAVVIGKKKTKKTCILSYIKLYFIHISSGKCFTTVYCYLTSFFSCFFVFIILHCTFCFISIVAFFCLLLLIVNTNE